MYYMICSEDVPNSLPLRKQVREQHLARLQELKAQDRLLIAGPLPAVDLEDPAAAYRLKGAFVPAFVTDIRHADGAAWTLRSAQRWRVWRRPLAALA